ncbi:30 kDa heat shock protein [Blumeria hordei DH14]|uniref:30 kDa heat shock protein n=1 Tax=Blumeria graminis f. sp. hordei (strain DH14) TaxID=546991 RepID=N1JJ58_BLUG1|nr:30 kDa heat shock protein [Blumeria hordei DH14]
MSLFPRSYITQNQSSVPPIIRLLDEFDRYSRNVDYSSDEVSQNYRNRDRSPHHVKSFSPKFDIKELSDAYELYGELPGIAQEDVDMEFTDASTITIKGRIERNYSGVSKNVQGSEGSSKPVRKATVEDECASQESKVSLTRNEGVNSKPSEKFWVMERSIGEFSRSFAFPVRVDQDNVKASMKNGILSVFVPKGWKQEGRKITIQ